MPSNNINILNSLKVGIRRFPDDILLKYAAPSKLVMTLTKKAAGFSSNPINMQDNRACFEAWCLIIKAKTKEQKLEIEIELDVKDI